MEEDEQGDPSLQAMALALWSLTVAQASLDSVMHIVIAVGFSNLYMFASVDGKARAVMAGRPARVWRVGSLWLR